MGVAVEVRALRKAYGRTVAVEDVSFEVEEGEIFGLLGPNGSGKTTSVECTQGFLRADDGRLRVFGVDVRTDPERIRGFVGSQLQDSALPDRMRVWEALHLFSALSPGGRPWPELLADWGLSEHRDKPFAALSGGERQRLFVALALIGEPRLVVLDEMTTGLDPAARRVAWDLVADVRQRGATVLLVTHFMDEAERLCDRLAVLVRGRVAAQGTAAELVRAYRPEVAVLFTVPADGCGRTSVDLDFLTRVDGVRTLERGEQGAVRVTGSGPLLARVGHALVEQGIEPDDLHVQLPTLEDAYLALTSKDGGA